MGKSITEIRQDFPILDDSFAYLDNAATSQKPKSVIDAVADYYRQDNANPMRGIYDLSVRATEGYESSRKKVASFINAAKKSEIIFTRNASESLNLVSYSYGSTVKEGSNIVVGITEHHSNFLPWQRLAKERDLEIRYYYPDEKGYLDPDKLEELVDDNTAILAVNQVSNILGRVNDIKTFAEIVHKHGGVIVCDGAQSVPHMKVDVQDLDVDFLAFSGHKMLGPMGIGVLYGKKELLKAMPPFLYGGEMIESVSIEKTKFAAAPHKFEAGTVNAGGAIGLKAAIEYYEEIGMDFVEKRELELTKYALEQMKDIPYVTVLGSDDYREHTGILTFDIEGCHPHDVAEIMSSNNVCIRAGHHCAQPLLKALGHPVTSRVSLGFYNTEAEIDMFIATLKTMRRQLGYGE